MGSPLIGPITLANIEFAHPDCQRARCGRTTCTCRLRNQTVSWNNQLIHTLGSRPCLHLDEADERAIASHYNRTALGIYPARATDFDVARALGEDQSWKAFNACPVGPDALLLNIQDRGRGTAGNGRPLQLAGVAHTSVLLLQRGEGGARVEHELHNAEDARAVVVNGSAFALFARYRARQRKRMWLAALSPPYTEVMVHYALAKDSEGNWMPFEHAGQLYASYSLCPHVVLLIDPHTGAASQAFSSMLTGCSKRLRGSASGALVAELGGVLGVAHSKSPGPGRYYAHFLFLRSPMPPFALLSVSPPFRFSLFLQPSGRQDRSDLSVQFTLSLSLAPHEGQCRPRDPGSARSSTPAAARGPSAALLVDFSADDTVALRQAISHRKLCNFTGWCDRSKWCDRTNLSMTFGGSISKRVLRGAPSDSQQVESLRRHGPCKV